MKIILDNTNSIQFNNLNTTNMACGGILTCFNND